jgi:hypothetical protein
MVPGVIPSDVKALQSGKQAGIIPRYQQALVYLILSMQMRPDYRVFAVYSRFTVDTVCRTGRIASGTR